VEDLIVKIQDAYADCTTCQEVAEVYALIKMENQKQMELTMNFRVDSEIEEADSK